MGKRRRTNLPKSNKRVRKNRRKLDLATSLRPVPCTVPSDPPRVKMSHEHSAILGVDLFYDRTKRTGFNSYGALCTAAQYSVQEPTAKGQHVSVSPSDIAKLIRAYMSYTDNTTFEICPRKICAWGPTEGQLLKETSPVLTVDTSNVSASVSVTDRGTAISRTRCGISIPFSLWLNCSSTAPVIRYTLDTGVVTPYSGEDTLNAGHLQISVTWRVSAYHL